MHVQYGGLVFGPEWDGARKCQIAALRTVSHEGGGGLRLGEELRNEMGGDLASSLAARMCPELGGD